MSHKRDKHGLKWEKDQKEKKRQRARENIARLQTLLRQATDNEDSSRERNEKLMRDIKRVEDHGRSLEMKTHHLKTLKHEFEDYMGRVYPKWMQLLRHNQYVQDIRDAPLTSTQKAAGNFRHFSEPKNARRRPEIERAPPRMPSFLSDTKENLPQKSSLLSPSNFSQIPLMQQTDDVLPHFHSFFQISPDNDQGYPLRDSVRMTTPLRRDPSTTSMNSTQRGLFRRAHSPEAILNDSHLHAVESLAEMRPFSATAKSKADESLKVIPQVMALTPDGRIVLLPMTTTLGSQDEYVSRPLSSTPNALDNNDLNMRAMGTPERCTPDGRVSVTATLQNGCRQTNDRYSDKRNFYADEDDIESDQQFDDASFRQQQVFPPPNELLDAPSSVRSTSNTRIVSVKQDKELGMEDATPSDQEVTPRFNESEPKPVTKEGNCSVGDVNGNDKAENFNDHLERSKIDLGVGGRVEVTTDLPRSEKSTTSLRIFKNDSRRDSFEDVKIIEPISIPRPMPKQSPVSEGSKFPALGNLASKLRNSEEILSLPMHIQGNNSRPYQEVNMPPGERNVTESQLPDDANYGISEDFLAEPFNDQGNVNENVSITPVRLSDTETIEIKELDGVVNSTSGEIFVHSDSKSEPASQSNVRCKHRGIEDTEASNWLGNTFLANKENIVDVEDSLDDEKIVKQRNVEQNNLDLNARSPSEKPDVEMHGGETLEGILYPVGKEVSTRAVSKKDSLANIHALSIGDSHINTDDRLDKDYNGSRRLSLDLGSVSNTDSETDTFDSQVLTGEIQRNCSNDEQLSRAEVVASSPTPSKDNKSNVGEEQETIEKSERKYAITVDSKDQSNKAAEIKEGAEVESIMSAFSSDDGDDELDDLLTSSIGLSGRKIKPNLTDEGKTNSPSPLDISGKKRASAVKRKTRPLFGEDGTFGIGNQSDNSIVELSDSEDDISEHIESHSATSALTKSPVEADHYRSVNTASRESYHSDSGTKIDASERIDGSRSISQRIKKPGFWENSDSEPELDFRANAGDQKNHDGGDDDFDFDFYN